MAAERMQRIPSRLREWIERAKTGLLQRYQRLQPREQRLLQAAALLLPVLAVVFGMALPLHDRLARLRADIGALAIQAGDANALADQLRARGGKAPALVNPMSGIEQAAQQAGVRGFVTRIKPDLTLGDGRQRLIVDMKAAPYADVVRFLGLLRAQGMAVSRAKLYAIDRPGQVDVELTLSN